MKTVWKHENDSYILHMPNAKLEIFFDSWNTNTSTPWQWSIVFTKEKNGCKAVSGNSKTLKQAKMNAMQFYDSAME